MTDIAVDNSFTITMCDVPVHLPHRDDGVWTLREVLAWAPDNSDWHLKKTCIEGCSGKGGCSMLPPGTMLEVTSDDAMEIRFMAPAEVERRRAQGLLWMNDEA
ncbi:hypothetical protein RKD23_001277 [Streptomyces sp. SAI-170]|uniref:hypothetical protein n=1 Tax=Streptomyces sp. SAI-170 TaxID=3377729 RepID=UPI003C7E0210